MKDVTDAIAEHNAKTCVRWVPRTNENDYIFFTPGDTGGCVNIYNVNPCTSYSYLQLSHY